MKYSTFISFIFCCLFGCKHENSISEREYALAGTEKKTWMLSKQNKKSLSRPYRGFTFYRKNHFYQNFSVTLNSGKYTFYNSINVANQDISVCDCTWDITGDTVFIAYPKIGRTPFLRIINITKTELSYQEFNSKGKIAPFIITALATPDTVSNWTLNCPPSYRFESTHENVKMLD